MGPISDKKLYLLCAPLAGKLMLIMILRPHYLRTYGVAGVYPMGIIMPGRAYPKGLLGLDLQIEKPGISVCDR